jgi:hypothetical protein
MEHEKLNRLLPDGVDPSESDALDATWRLLGAIDAPEPDSDRMRARLDSVIDAVEHSHPVAQPSMWQRHVLQGLAAAALLVIGIGIGHYVLPRGGSAFDGARAGETGSLSEISAMRSEMHDLREMVSLSLMQQQSASERLKGVSWIGQIDRPSNELAVALLDTLMHDPNVNVRLATVDALERFASEESVRRAAVAAMDRQTSPFVQIALIDFMVKVKDRESVATLRRLSQDPAVNDAVRMRAVSALQQLG